MRETVENRAHPGYLEALNATWLQQRLCRALFQDRLGCRDGRPQLFDKVRLPDLSAPALYMELGSLGLKYVLENRGSGYFPRRLVAPYLADKRLKLIGTIN